LLKVTKALSLVGATPNNCNKEPRDRQAADQTHASPRRRTAAAVIASVIQQLSSSSIRSRSVRPGRCADCRTISSHQIRQQLTDAQNAAISLTSTLRAPGTLCNPPSTRRGSTGQQLTTN